MIDKNFNEIKIPRLLKNVWNKYDWCATIFVLVIFFPIFSFSVMYLKVQVIK